MTDSPQVSVVIPTRNRTAMLRQALSSALGQESVELEVIVVDEASSDGTLADLAQIADQRLTVIAHETPRGVAGARNRAIGEARGGWIAFLDDDDLWAPRKLATQLGQAAQRGYELSYTGRVEIDDAMAVRRVITPAADPERELLLGNVVGTPSSVMISAALIERIGTFDERLEGLADWDLWLRALAAGAPIGACPEPLIAYRRHAGAMTGNEAKMLGDFQLLKEKHGALARQAGVDFGAVWLASWLGMRDAAEQRRLRPARRYLRRAVADRSALDVARAIGALGGAPVENLGRSILARRSQRPDWLDLYS